MTGPRRIWTIGEALAALVSPDTRALEHVNHLNVGMGGAEFNVAIGVARLGHAAAWIGVVGDDPWGRQVRRELRAEGVDVRARVTGESFTAAYVRERRAGTCTRATYLRRGSAGSMLCESDLALLEPRPGDVVHLTGITPALSQSAREAWSGAVDKAKSSGALVSVDVNFRSKLWAAMQARKAFADIARHVDLLLASPEEASLVFGLESTEPQTCAKVLQGLLAPGAQVVMKLGAAGSMHFDPDGLATHGAALQVPVVDPVGAGDAFAAGFLSGALDGLSVSERLVRAHACAAYVVASSGDWEGLPRPEEMTSAHLLANEELQR